MLRFGAVKFQDACDVWSHDEIVVDEKGRQLRLQSDGSINFSDISHTLLHQQDQYLSYHAQGGIDGYPHLGRGLQITDGAGNPGNHAESYEMGISREDTPVFVGRVIAYQALTQGVILDGDLHRDATPEERVHAAQYLLEQGFGE